MISLIHPSRGRPDKAYQTYKNWISKSGDKVEHILSLDLSDPARTKYLEYEWPHVIVNDNDCVVQATNQAAKLAKGNILIYLSDDFDCPNDWVIKVEKEFDKEDRPLLLKVDDCLQKFDVAVLTIPIMNRQLYDRLGYFWHPDYKSMFCDEHLFWVCRKIGALKMAATLKFPHLHHKDGDDETYRRSSKNWDQGKALFQKHRAQGFI